MSRARRQVAAKQILRQVAAIVTYHWADDFVDSPYPRWLECVLGEDFFGRIDVVLVFDKPISHEVAQALGTLRDVESLTLNHCTIADVELLHIKDLADCSVWTLDVRG